MNNRSPQSNTNTLSQNLTSKLSPSTDQSLLTTEKKFSFSHRLRSITNEQTKTKSVDSSSSSTPEITTNNTNYTSDQSSHHDKIESTSPSESFSTSFLPKIRQKPNNQYEIQNNNYSPSNSGRSFTKNSN